MEDTIPMVHMACPTDHRIIPSVPVTALMDLITLITALEIIQHLELTIMNVDLYSMQKKVLGILLQT